MNPADSFSMVFVNSSYPKIYRGQTSIIRFNITLNDRQDYTLSLKIQSNLAQDNFEILNFFASNVGDNFPCISMSNLLTTDNGYKAENLGFLII